MVTTIINFLFPIFEYFLRKYASDERAKADYIAFLEIMSRKGILSASNRLAAQDQIDAVNDLWKKEKEKTKV